VFGWCPGALRPMMSGDGLVVRLRVPMGRLSPEQIRHVATLARTYGNGMIDLSARANLQLRGVTTDSHAALIDGLREIGLVDADLAAEARRNITVTPFWQDGDDSQRVAQTLARALSNHGAPDLPSKFGFAIDCGERPVLTRTSADIRVEHSAAGLICRADGAGMGQPVTVDTAADAALALARWFLDTGGVTDGRGRMAAHIATQGAPEAADTPPLPAVAPPEPSVTAHGTLLGFAFGQTTAESFAQLAELGALRLTPWRMVLIEGAAITEPLPDFITDARDPRRRVQVCTGAPGCRQALSDTRDAARAIAAHLSPDSDDTIHISGCAKGCAHPAPAPVTLTASHDGHFTLIRHGRAGDPPQSAPLTVTQIQDRRL
ncbi:MAG TPA: precorrin-3B synthase, partial [Sulfitobacter pontiacus]|nr:precorrin-3B synthase [Sulfitobacter pontiacus]